MLLRTTATACATTHNPPLVEAAVSMTARPPPPGRYLACTLCIIIGILGHNVKLEGLFHVSLNLTCRARTRTYCLWV